MRLRSPPKRFRMHSREYSETVINASACILPSAIFAFKIRAPIAAARSASEMFRQSRRASSPVSRWPQHRHITIDCRKQHHAELWSRQRPRLPPNVPQRAMTIGGRSFHRGNRSAQQARFAPFRQRLRGFLGIDKKRVACVPIQLHQRAQQRAGMPAITPPVMPACSIYGDSERSD